MKWYFNILVLLGCFVNIFNGYSQNSVVGTVEFVVNTDKIIENQDYERFVLDMVPYIKANSERIEYITLIGSASPEGGAARNSQLANIRSEKIYSYIKDCVPISRVIINNSRSLFLLKTGFDEHDYPRLRAVYIEIQLRNEPQPVVKDTVFIRTVDTVRFKEPVFVPFEKHNKPVFAVYNDLLSDILFRCNVGAEIYFNKMSFFIEGSFSNWNLIGKTYNIDIWHTGLIKYFNNDYKGLFIEVYANAGYFDTDLFSAIGKVGVMYGGGVGIGYAFDLCSHWQICPIVRIGLFERIYYADYYSGNGNIGVSFGNYSNGTIDNTSHSSEGGNYVTAPKTITGDFFENSNKAFYIGPTYVGIVLKKGFCINKR